MRHPPSTGREYADVQAAPVVLASTNESVLAMVPMEALQELAIDLPADPGSLAD